MHKDLAVIIPVFNDPDGLESVLRSISCSVKHSFFSKEQIEIIVVDDGSSVSYDSIINEIKLDIDIRLFKQENGRQGKARNFGLSKSIANYVWFVDADDEVTLGSIKTIIENIIIDKNIDLFYFDADCYGDTKESARDGWSNTKIASSVAENKLIVAPWARVYSRSYLSEIELTYPEYLKYEDLYHSVIATLRSRRHKVIHECIYKYNYTEGSTTKKHDSSVIDIFDVINKIESDTQNVSGVDDDFLQTLAYVHGIKYTLIRLYQSRSISLFFKTLTDNKFSACLEKISMRHRDIKIRVLVRFLFILSCMVKSINKLKI